MNAAASSHLLTSRQTSNPIAPSPSPLPGLSGWFPRAWSRRQSAERPLLLQRSEKYAVGVHIEPEQLPTIRLIDDRVEQNDGRSHGHA